MKHIKCKTKEQMRKVLKKLENDGYRWASGTMPTKLVPFDSYGEDTVIEVDDKRRELAYASYGYFVENHVKVFIDSEDFVRDKKNRPSIVIFRRGRNVIAKDVATGNEGIAKCSPDDEFVFKTGASIALARLMAKTPDALNHDAKDEWIKALGLTPVEKRVYTDAELLLAFEREDHVDTSLDFEVVKIAPHKLFSQKPIAYIKHKGDFRTICYLFDIEALEKV